jgi:hypothetical protein
MQDWNGGCQVQKIHQQYNEEKDSFIYHMKKKPKKYTDHMLGIACIAMTLLKSQYLHSQVFLKYKR